VPRETKKPTWRNTLGYSTTSVYSATGTPAMPGRPLPCHPTISLAFSCLRWRERRGHSKSGDCERKPQSYEFLILAQKSSHTELSGNLIASWTRTRRLDKSNNAGGCRTESLWASMATTDCDRRSVSWGFSYERHDLASSGAVTTTRRVGSADGIGAKPANWSSHARLSRNLNPFPGTPSKD
jgi:hypothetical protein